MCVCVGGRFGHLQSRGIASVEGQTESNRLLQLQAIPFGTQLVVQRFVPMQNNDEKHSSKLSQRYNIKGKDEQHVIQLMSWPALSVDLKPIELV